APLGHAAARRLGRRGQGRGPRVGRPPRGAPSGPRREVQPGDPVAAGRRPALRATLSSARVGRTLRFVIDLRSDTVTQPCEPMRQAMAAAAVGDDQFGEDPTTNELQERVAALLRKEAALWLPTGTMANQVALRTLTRPGDDVVVAAGAHIVWSEAGAGAANAGVQFTELGGSRGYFDREQFLAARKPRSHELLPPTTLVAFENTHNRAGGVAVPMAVTEEVCAAAAEEEGATLLEGARLWYVVVSIGEVYVPIT